MLFDRQEITWVYRLSLGLHSVIIYFQSQWIQLIMYTVQQRSTHRLSSVFLPYVPALQHTQNKLSKVKNYDPSSVMVSISYHVPQQGPLCMWGCCTSSEWDLAIAVMLFLQYSNSSNNLLKICSKFNCSLFNLKSFIELLIVLEYTCSVYLSVFMNGTFVQCFTLTFTNTSKFTVKCVTSQDQYIKLLNAQPVAEYNKHSHQ